jgi:hypothetical protein
MVLAQQIVVRMILSFYKFAIHLSNELNVSTKMTLVVLVLFFLKTNEQLHDYYDPTPTNAPIVDEVVLAILG